MPIQNHPQSAITLLETVSAQPELPSHSSHPTDVILTNPLRSSFVASGIWLNTTTLNVASQSSSDIESKSTLILTVIPHATSAAVSVSTDGIAVSSDIDATSTLSLTMPSQTTPTSASMSSDGVPEASAVNTTIPVVMPSATGSISQLSVPGYAPTVVTSTMNSTLTVPDDRPSAGLSQFTVSVSDNFISLPSDLETSWSIAGEVSTVTDMEDFPTVKPDPTAANISVATDGTFVSSDASPYPTAVPIKRYDGKQLSHVDGTISMVHVTTTIALQGINSTSIATGSTGTVSRSYLGAPTESFTPNGAASARTLPAWVVVVVLPLPALLPLAALF